MLSPHSVCSLYVGLNIRLLYGGGINMWHVPLTRGNWSECCVHGSGLINEGDSGRLRYRSILLSIYLIGDRHEESGARAPGALPGRIIGVLREPIFHSQGLRLE